MRRGISILVFLFCLIFFGSLTVYALVNFDTLEKDVSAGAIEEGSFTVDNPAEADAHIDIKVNEYRYEFGPNFKAPKGDAKYITSAVPWLKITPSGLDLKPKETKEVKYTISVPKDATGEAIAEIFFDQVPLKDGKKDEINTTKGDYGFKLTITARKAVPVYLKVKEGKKIDGEISNIGVSKDWMTETTAVVFDLKNNGNTHFKAEGEVDIKTVGGIQIASQPFSNRKPIFQGYAEEISVLLKKKIEDGNYVAVVTANIDEGKQVTGQIKFNVNENGEVKRIE